MDIGINVNGWLKIIIGDSFKRVKDELDSRGVSYEIPYEGIGKYNKGRKEKGIILFIGGEGVELGVLNDEITYIKSSNISYNTLMKVKEDDNVLGILKEIVRSISKRFGVCEMDITLERFDTSNYNTTVKVKTDTNKRIKVGIMIHPATRKAYIRTIRLLDSKNKACKLQATSNR